MCKKPIADEEEFLENNVVYEFRIQSEIALLSFKYN